MKAIINGRSRDITYEEFDYLKRMYGDYEEVYVFNAADLYSVQEMAEVLNIKENTIYVRNRRNSVKYPLDTLRGRMGATIDTIFNFWIK